MISLKIINKNFTFLVFRLSSKSQTEAQRTQSHSTKVNRTCNGHQSLIVLTSGSAVVIAAESSIRLLQSGGLAKQSSRDLSKSKISFNIMKGL